MEERPVIFGWKLCKSERCIRNDIPYAEKLCGSGKMKQQKKIRAFLIEEFGEKKGAALFDRQKKMLAGLIGNTGKYKPGNEFYQSNGQKKVLAGTILPCIAMYKALSEDERCGKKAGYELVQKYLLDKAAAGQHSSIVKMEIIPGFFALYSSAFLITMRLADLWESTQKRGNDSFDITITKCLWHTACKENGCPELCRLFCDADNVTYGGLKKMGFQRTVALGYGGDRCDFHFYKHITVR